MLFLGTAFKCAAVTRRNTVHDYENGGEEICVLKNVCGCHDIFLHPLDEFDKGRIEAILTKDSDLNYFQIRVKYLGRSQET